MQAVNLNIKGIKCDNENCDYRDDTVDFKDYGPWLNKPCPKCGTSLLTEEDLNSLTLMVNVGNICNGLIPDVPEDTPKVTITAEMNGTGKVKLKLKDMCSINLKTELMQCGLCNEKVEPLDAHMGYIDGKFDVFHIDCWNNHLHLEKINEVAAICATCKNFNHFCANLWVCDKKYKAGITTIGSIVDAADTCDKHEPKVLGEKV